MPPTSQEVRFLGRELQHVNEIVVRKWEAGKKAAEDSKRETRMLVGRLSD